MTTNATHIANIFEFAPSAHLLKIEPDGKAPLKGSQWRNHPLSMEDAIAWAEAGNHLGIVPATGRASVADIDIGGQESLALAKSTIGDPVVVVETNSHTPENPRWHCIYPHDPSTPVGNARWQGGDIRADAGYVVMWSIEKWADAISRIAVQELPPVNINRLKSAKSSLLASVNNGLHAGLHPTALGEIGMAIRTSETWDECKAKCSRIIDDYCQRRIARDGDTKATRDKCESDIKTWNQAIPKWWAEKEATAAKQAERVILQTSTEHPARAMSEGLTRCGYQFRTLLYGMRPTYKHKDEDDSAWVPLTDGNQASLMIEMGDRCAWQITKKEELHHRPLVVPPNREKQAIRSLSWQTIYDPIKEYLDGLPEWTPDMPSRIFTFFEDAGLNVEAEQTIAQGKTVSVSDWAQSYFFVELVRYTLYPGAQRMPLMVLRGTGDEGKSSIGKMILPEQWRKALFSDKFRLSLDDQKRAMICIRNKVLEVPEFGVYRKGDWDEIKAGVFEDNSEARLPYGEHITEVARHDVMYITTNKANLPEDDEAIHRRFIYVNLRGEAMRLNKVAYYHLDEIIDGHPLRDWLFAEAKHFLAKQANPETYCQLPDLKPKEWMEFNRLQGGTFATPGTSFQEAVSDVIDWLIECEKPFVPTTDMKMYVALVLNGKSPDSGAEVSDDIEARGINNARIENAIKRDAIGRTGASYRYGRTERVGGSRGFILNHRNSQKM